MKELKLSTEIYNIFWQHRHAIEDGFDSINMDVLINAANVILAAVEQGKTIYTAGNGASAAIAQHWACD